MRRILAAFALSLAVCAAAVFIRAALLPAPRISVLRYGAVVKGIPPADSDAVAADTLFEQLNDLLAGGFSPVTPSDLFARRFFGARFPEQPFCIEIGGHGRDNGEALAFAAETMLSALGVPALIPCDGKDRIPPALAPYVENGLVIPVSAKELERFEKYADVVDVSGGQHLFDAALLQDSLDPAFFGTVRLKHTAGERIPLTALVYTPGGMEPVARLDIAPADPEAEFKLAIPSGVDFPLEIVVYDCSRVVFYFSKLLYKRDAIRAPGYRTPVLPPSDELQFDPI